MAKQDQFKGKTTLKEMAQNWAEVYGEDLANDYGGFYDELYEKYGNKPVPLAEVKQAWRSAYGEDLNMEYEGFWESIGGKKHISYVNEDGDILEDYEEGAGTFIDQNGDIVENPDDEEHELSFGESSMTPTEFMSNKIQGQIVKKNKDKFYNEAPYGEEDEEEMMANEAPYGEEDEEEKPAAQPKPAMKPEAKPMKEINMDQVLKQSGMGKPLEKGLDKEFNIKPVKKGVK